MDIGFIMQMFLRMLLTQIPVLLVCLLGVVLAIVFWGKCRRAGLLTVLAMVLLLIASIVFALTTPILLQSRTLRHWSARQYEIVSIMMTVVRAFLNAGGLGLLLAAVFVGRKSPAASP